ncbi:MAG TPA: ABC transporter substrate-binding protein, partial [Ilumatobacteraceae bacterium]|nr:ABC transporter substrate-binding protein [Ilumatobacteraceae bacterium]
MRRTKRTSAVLLASFALIAAACSDDKDSSSSTAASTTAAPTGSSTDSTAAPSGSSDTSAAPSDGKLLSYDESKLCGTKEYGGNLAKLEAKDANTVVFTLCTPDVALPSKVAFSALQILPSEYLESTGGKGDLVEKPIGTGPYKLGTWDKGSQIVLER